MRLHTDTSGVTLSRGRPSGPGMVATAFAGYVAPCLLGLGIAALAGTDQYLVPLVVCLVLLVGMLLTVIALAGLALYAIYLAYTEGSAAPTITYAAGTQVPVSTLSPTKGLALRA